MQNGFKKQSNTSSPISHLQEKEALILKRLLKRRQNARLVCDFDEAIPSFYAHRVAKTSPIIHISQEQPLSPYIIRVESLKRASGEEELADAILINLLTNPVSSSLTRTQKEDLLLTPEDTLRLLLNQQINPDPLKEKISPTVSKPCYSPLPSNIHGYIPSPLQNPFASVSTFSCPQPPKDIFSYFDLPETEEENEESELVDLTTLERLMEKPLLSIETRSLPPSRASFPRLSSHTFSIPWIRLPQEWGRAMIAFVLVSFAIVLPIHAANVVKNIQETKSHVMTLGTQGLSSFESATQEALVLDAKGAERSFTQAISRFDEAQQSLQDLGTGAELLSVIPTTKAHTASTLLEAAKRLSYAGLRLSQGWSALESSWQTDTTTRLAILATHLQTVLPYIEEAQTLLDSVDKNDLAQEQKIFLDQTSTKLPLLIGSLQTFLTLNDFAQTALGADGSKHYLLLFQNQTELRPTGGFVGSYAEVNAHKGSLENLSIPGGGSYDLQGQMQTSFIAPKPLRLLNARWEFQDANWFADFPTSARNTLLLYEDAGGPTVDGVVAINASFLETLLGLLGPVEMPAYGRTITEENFLLETQKIVEYEYDKTVNQPKAFIGDLSVALLDRLSSLSPTQYLSVIKTVQEGFATKDIQAYFTDENLQKQTLAYNWGGEIKQPSGDYLMVVDTNLGGGKTDGFVNQHVDIKITVATDGTLTNTVTITRTHQGALGDLFTGINNVDYLRLYTPKGSTLLSANGFSIPDDRLFEIPEEDWMTSEYLSYLEDTLHTDPLSGTDISEESGKTVFGNWVQTAPGSTSSVQFTYRLPFQLQDLSPASFMDRLKQFFGMDDTTSYTLYLQKQSGVTNREITVHVKLPETMKTLWSSLQTEETPLSNTTDQTFAILVDRNH